MKSIKSANGVRGCLIRSLGGESFLRVTDDNGDFRDYWVTHHDLDISIDDESAWFYEHNGEFYLDYSPDSLMLSDEDLSAFNDERLTSRYDKGASE